MQFSGKLASQGTGRHSHSNPSNWAGASLLNLWTIKTGKIHSKQQEDRGRYATIISGSASSQTYRLNHDSVNVYLMEWRRVSVLWTSAAGFSILLTWSSLMMTRVGSSHLSPRQRIFFATLNPPTPTLCEDPRDLRYRSIFSGLNSASLNITSGKRSKGTSGNQYGYTTGDLCFGQTAFSFLFIYYIDTLILRTYTVDI